MGQSYDLAILDFDGTLADTYPWFESVLNEAAERFSFRPIDAGDRDVLRASTPRQILARLGLPLWKVPIVTSHMRARMAADLHRLSLFDGVPRLLAAISDAGARSVIVSSNAESNIRAMLGPDAAAHIADYECGTSMFGKASRASSVAFGAVAWGYNTREALCAQNPAHVFDTMEDIVCLFSACVPDER
jgi:phosphoglycolate phosphatase